MSVNKLLRNCTRPCKECQNQSVALTYGIPQRGAVRGGKNGYMHRRTHLDTVKIGSAFTFPPLVLHRPNYKNNY